MSPRPVRWLALLSLLSACEDPDTGIKVHNNDPEASIDSPVEGAQVLVRVAEQPSQPTHLLPNHQRKYLQEE